MNNQRFKDYYWRHPFTRLAKESNRNKWNDVKQKITSVELWRLAKRQKLLCPLSGRRLTNENISVDHIMPIKSGGTNTIDNIQLTVKEINYAKHTMNQTEFVKLCKDVANLH